MTFKEAIKKCEWIIPVLLILGGTFFGGMKYGEHRAYASIEVGRDTVIKTVTVYKDFPQPKETASAGFIAIPAYKFFTDTVYATNTVLQHDTTVVYLPREQQYYEEEEGRLRLWVSGYEPRLDRYELDAQVITITNTVTEKPSRWGLSISGGYGVALVGKSVQLAPYIGVGVSYTFLRF